MSKPKDTSKYNRERDDSSTPKDSEGLDALLHEGDSQEKVGFDQTEYRGKLK